MTRMNRFARARWGPAATAMCLLILAPAGASGAAYEFTQLVEVPAQEQGAFGFPAINNAGVVAFYSNVSGVGEQIVRGRGVGPLEVVAAQGADFVGSFGSGVSINDAGTVAFYGGRNAPDSNGIYTRTGPGAAPRFVGGAGGEFSINNAGVVAYFGPDGVYAGDGATRRLISEGGVAVYPHINNAGLVGFGTGSGILLGDGSGPARQFLDNSGPLGQIDQFSINDRGDVVFRAVAGLSKMGIYVADAAGIIRTVADTTSGPYIFLRNPSINNNGDVVFIGQTSNDSMGLYTGPDAVADKVIESRDLLFGLRAGAFDAYADSINDSGEVAFTYQSFTEDGVRTGVAVARPVPEPGAAATLALGAVMLLRRRIRGRCAAPAGG